MLPEHPASPTARLLQPQRAMFPVRYLFDPRASPFSVFQTAQKPPRPAGGWS
jgi:hypothetical protein